MLLILGALILLLWASKGILFRWTISYDILGPRRATGAPSRNWTDWMDAHTVQSQDINLLVDHAQRLTAEQLQFSFKPCPADPNTLLLKPQANCIGYAQFLAWTCNGLFERNDLAQEWKASPQIAHLYFLGIDVHPLFKSGFLRDHDFVRVENQSQHIQLDLDASLMDYFGITRVRAR